MNIQYSPQAKKFIQNKKNEKHKHTLKSKIEKINSYFIDSTNQSLDIKKLNPKTKNRFRLSVGKIRVVFEKQKDIINIASIDYRKDVYKK